MCGISGFLDRHEAESAEARLEPMLAAIEKRGPDGFGRWIQPTRGVDGKTSTVALGHRRLSIIDLEGGSQPLANEDQSIQIVFNGEIFNFKELRTQLQAAGHVFSTDSDTEVIVHLYEEYGTDGFARLNGMFAFAIWDGKNQKLVLARDRAGIKPLYYKLNSSDDNFHLIYASQLDSVLKHPSVSTQISAFGLCGYFFADYAHAPTTVVDGVQKLEPGHWISLDTNRKVQSGSFWKQQDAGQTKANRTALETWEKQLAAALETAVERQLIADVPVGSFLSGGIDSSLVTAIASKKYKGSLNTFSIGFRDPEFDESVYAQRVADHFKTNHHTQTIDETDLLNTLDEALDTLDEPMADPSIIPTYILSKLAAKTVKVVLGGDGGDELFGGYPTYVATQASRKWERIPEPVRQVARAAIRRLPTSHGYQPLEWKLKRFTLRWDQDPVRRHLRWMSALDLPEVPRFVQGLGAFTPATFSFQRDPHWDPLQLAMALDFSTYMPGSVLAKVDRASMACGLEVRPPFLDNDVIALAQQIPSHLKVQGKIRKFVLKQTAEQYLPKDIVHRPKKGFAIPLSKWIAGPLDDRLQRIFKDSQVWNHLNGAEFEELRQDHRRRRRDASKPLWSLIVFDRWLQNKT